MKNKIEKFDKATLAKLRKEMQDALNEIGDKYEIALQLKNIRFDDKKFGVKLEGNTLVEGADGVPVKDNFYPEWQLARLGLTENPCGKTFIHNGKDFVVVELKTRSRKYPIVGKEVGGDQMFKFKTDVLK